MRRGVVAAMSVVTLAVVGLSLRSSARPVASPDPGAAVTVERPRSVKARATPSATPKRTGGHRPTAGAAPASVTVNGDSVDTDYGPVRVQLTMQGGRIISARAIVRPEGDSQTEAINSYAVPILDKEAVAAQSSKIDTVSGATFTSGGYRQSLQSALDAAHQAGSR
jgi:uncharacterized protein with FMN-binding domain